jgi:hypothetical protein
MKSLHPEAIKVEHFNRNVSRFHPFKERVDRLFIVIGCETGGKPESEAPTRNLPGFTGQDGILFKHFFRGRSMDDVPSNRSVQHYNTNDTGLDRVNVESRKGSVLNPKKNLTISTADPQHWFGLCSTSHFQPRARLCLAYQ